MFVKTVCNICVRSDVLTVVTAKSSTFWDTMLRSPVSTDVLEEYITSIFRVKVQAKQEKIMKQAACKVYSYLLEEVRVNDSY